MNANIKKKQSFLQNKYDLKGHLRSHKDLLKFQNHLFLRYIICLPPILLKLLSFFKNSLMCSVEKIPSNVKYSKKIFNYIQFRKSKIRKTPYK